MTVLICPAHVLTKQTRLRFGQVRNCELIFLSWCTNSFWISMKNVLVFIAFALKLFRFLCHLRVLGFNWKRRGRRCISFQIIKLSKVSTQKYQKQNTIFLLNMAQVRKYTASFNKIHFTVFPILHTTGK